MPRTYPFINKDTVKLCTIQLVVALLYLLFGLLIHHFITSHGIVSIVWPGSGLALAALLIGGRRFLWGVLLGSLLLNAIANDSLWAIFGITLANMLEAYLGYWLLSRNSRQVLLLRTLPDYLMLITLGGCLVSIAGAMVGSVSLRLAGILNAANFFENTLHWWMGDVLGVVLLTPFILAWSQPSVLTGKQFIEKLLLISMTFLMGQIVFLGWFQELLSDTPKGYFLFLFVSWVAIRLGVRGTTFVLLMVAVQAITGAYKEVGFFAHDIARADLANYWAYMLILSLVGMAMASYINEIKLGLAALKLKDSALNSAANEIVITDVKGQIEWANQAFSQITGYSLNEAFGRNPSELVKSGKQNQAFYKSMWDTILAKKVWHGEIVNRRKDSVLYDEEMTITPLLNEHDEIVHFVAVKQVITERKRIESALQESQAFVNAILNSVPNEIIVLDSNGLVVATNNSWQRFAHKNATHPGTQPAHTDVGSNYLEVCRTSIGMSSEGAMSAYEGIRAVLDRRQSFFSLEYPCHSPKEQRWFAMSVTPLEFTWRGAVVSHTDITERKLAEAKLVENESRLRAIIENEPECIKIIDAQGHLKQMNPAGLAMIEADSLEQVIGLPLRSVIAPEFRAAFDELHQRVLSGLAMKLEFEVIGFKGHRRWLETHAVPLRDKGEVLHLAITRDITERKLAENLWLESETRFRAILENSPIAIRITKMVNNKVVFANLCYAELIGYLPEKVIGINPAQFYANPQDYADTVALLNNGVKITNKLVKLRVHENLDATKWALASYLFLEYQNEPSILGWLYDNPSSTKRSAALKKSERIRVLNPPFSSEQGCCDDFT